MAQTNSLKRRFCRRSRRGFLITCSFFYLSIQRLDSSNTGNPGSLCVGKYREHMKRRLGLKIC